MNNTIKSGEVSIIRTGEFFDYGYLIETSTSTIYVSEQELEDLEICIWKRKGWEITHQNKKQVFIKKLPKDAQKTLKKKGIKINKPKKK